MDTHPRADCRATHLLDGRPGSTSAALDHTRAFLRRCSPPLSRSTSGDLLLLVSELVTNAVKHAPGPCTLGLVCNGHLAVTVSDSNPAAPVARTPDLLSGTGGFGWHVVSELAECVQVRVRPPHGKSVTATLDSHRR
jgi:anti-sigma regulatory factor (Ser/Thr protein kinase)